jgi:hypothetical protein
LESFQWEQQKEKSGSATANLLVTMMVRSPLGLLCGIVGMSLFSFAALWIMPEQGSDTRTPPLYLRSPSLQEQRLHRELLTPLIANVELYFAIQYLNQSIASQLETLDPSNEAVSHFCKSVNEQVWNLHRMLRTYRGTGHDPFEIMSLHSLLSHVISSFSFVLGKGKSSYSRLDASWSSLCNEDYRRGHSCARLPM